MTKMIEYAFILVHEAKLLHNKRTQNTRSNIQTNIQTKQNKYANIQSYASQIHLHLIVKGKHRL